MLTEAQTAALTEYDFVLVFDKSGSMAEPNKGTSGPSRYEYMQESAVAFTRQVCQIDSDGIGAIFFGGSSIVVEDGCDTEKVKAMFANNRASGGTPLHLALEAAFKLAGKSAKKDFIVVFTDGVPDDKDAAAAVIRKQANSQETDDACTVLFVQIGDNAQATAYLKKLDDNLGGCKFDIVDTKTIDEVDAFASISELIIASIND